MRVLYGVVGDGMGHATRSRVVAEHLRARGHDVLLVASGKAATFLARCGLSVVTIAGLEGAYHNGAVHRGATALKTLRDAPAKLAQNLPIFYGTVHRFDPELVVTDFESFAYQYAMQFGVPVVCLDNQHVIDRSALAPSAVSGAEFDYATQRLVIAAKTPFCDRYLITSFFEPPIHPRHRHNTAYVPPIVRDLVARAEVTRDDHVLVYQSFGTDRAMLDSLRRLDARFTVYGFNRDEQVGNCTLKSFSEEGFVRDLASARAVVCNGGYSLLSECVYLRKPVFSVPLRHQFEQILNARYLDLLGYGVCHARLSPNDLQRFLADTDRHQRALNARPQISREETLARIAAHLDAVARKGLRRAA